ncbi:exonuclease domain-containing protein [Paraburkholderia sp. CNPSo 3076]|uniref:exonuclease domain-containing protein n=1 Tax=Paraburkholderia sp. CNPSo 3076 TaxID=2940936 RepID=UPI002256274A|nr:exonuclease domain-containing protein [Paraburkholderia sp. CNPSo 3076]MCX5538089.1 exonuclease domain-containing protein [Paraburkholderia sp. CNPSo 3076]
MPNLIAGTDIETTGLEWKEGYRIIEVAAVIYDLDTERRLGQYVHRIDPQRPIDPGAQKVHGLTFKQLAAEPVWGNRSPRTSR